MVDAEDEMISQVSSMLFRFFEQMDKEADSRDAHGRRAGLTGYARHWEHKDNKQESDVRDRLLALFQKAGFYAQKEKPYPRCSEDCDLFVVLHEQCHFWLEIKMAWKAWFCRDKGESEPNPSYRGYLKGKPHSVAGDVVKLERLASDSGQLAGLLVVGFDRKQDPMLPDMIRLGEQLGLQARGWHTGTAPFIIPNANHPDYRVVCFLWIRPLK